MWLVVLMELLYWLLSGDATAVMDQAYTAAVQGTNVSTSDGAFFGITGGTATLGAAAATTITLMELLPTQ